MRSDKTWVRPHQDFPLGWRHNAPKKRGAAMSLKANESSRVQTSSIHDDVEHLIRIAGQLMLAIEQQIHLIEQSLTVTPDVSDGPEGSTLLKEHLLRVAANINASLEEVALRLEKRSEQSSSPDRGRDNYAD
jgi:hypothetical protein